MKKGDLENRLKKLQEENETLKAGLKQNEEELKRIEKQQSGVFYSISQGKEVEEKFEKIFMASPDPIAVTSVVTGKYIEVNEIFLKEFGFSRNEVIDHTTIEIGIWNSVYDRKRFVEKLLTDGSIREEDFTLHLKNGNVGLFTVSSELIDLNNEKCILSVVRVVTESAEIQKKYKLLTENVSDVVWTMNPEGKFTYVSPSVEKLRGYTPEEVLKQNITDVLIPESAEWAMNSISEMLENEAKGIKSDVLNCIELKQICKNGSTVWTEVVISAVRDEDGQLKEIMGISRNIQRRKEVEEALIESNKKLEEAQRLSKTGNWYWDIRSGEVEWSNQVYQIFRLDPENFKPNIHSILEFSPWPEDHQRDQELIQRAIESKEEGEYEQRFLRSDGTIGYYHSSFQGLYDEADELQTIFGTVQDITDRKMTEIALLESEEKYRTLIESAHDTILIVQDGIIVFCNHLPLQRIGYTYEEIINQPFTIFFEPEKQKEVYEIYLKQKEEKNTQNTRQTEIVTKSGQKLVVEVTSSTFIYHSQEAELLIVHDISDRVAVERVLQEELLLLKTLLNYLPSSIFVLDNQYRKTACNQAHIHRIENTLRLKSNSLSEEDVIGKTNWEIYPKILADKYYEEDRKVIENGEIILDRESFQTDNAGNPVWENISKIPMRDHNGVIIGLVGIAQNITKNKLSEIALLESEERYRFLFERNPAPMLIYDRGSLKILAVNEAFINHYGYEKEQLLSMLLPDLYPDNEKEQIVQMIAGLTGYKNAREWHHKKANGELIAIVARSNDLIFENKRARVAVITDITDRKLMEYRLRASEEKFRLISNSAHDGIFMLNEDCELIYWNPAVEKIFEYPGEELAYRNINQLLHSAIQRGNEYLPIQVNNFSKTYGDTGITFEVEANKRDDNPIQIELSLAPLKISDQWGAVGIVRDISERKLVEQELIAAKERAEESDRLKSAFLATMSHELRTPLNAVIGFSELINDTMSVDEILGMVRIINDSGNHLLSIIDSVFSIALLQARVSKINVEEIHLFSFLNGLKPYLITKIGKERKEKLDLVVNLNPEELTQTIRSDKTKLTQMMVNFFDNAIKYTRQGFLEYGCVVNGKSVTFYVKDSGIGIPKDKQSIIFERFRQIEDSVTRSHGGVGLGLAICKEISDLLNGEIWLESEESKGTTFYFKLENVVV